MTGIERLRELAQEYLNCSKDHTTVDVIPYGVSVLLNDIADQIEHEQRRDPAADVSMSAYDLLPADERDAIAWVREHGGIAYVKDAWNVRSNLDRQLERAQAKVERQQRHIMFTQRKCRERQEHICELNKLKRAYVDALNGVCKRLGLTDGTGLPDMPEVIWAELDRRLVPEGMEWLVEAWPRFEDDAPVRFGDEAVGFARKPPFAIDHVTLFDGGESTVCAEADHDSGKVENFVRVLPGERVKRPAPKVLDADGAEVRVGDECYVASNGDGPYVVYCIREADGAIDMHWHENRNESLHIRPDLITHRAPVFAADGRPLKVGQTVWDVDGHGPLVVRAIPSEGEQLVVLDNGGTNCYRYPEKLAHERPVLGADGVPIHEGDTVWLTDGRGPWKVSRIVCADRLRVICDDEEKGHLNVYPEHLTHAKPEPPDSWERLEEDARELDIGLDGENTSDYPRMSRVRDIVRRAKALAERDA